MSDNISVTGNLATDPDYKRTPTGLAITNFRLATTERRFDRATGTWVDGARNFYSIATFRGLAEHAFASLKKGDRVVVTGRVRVREWDTGVKQGTSVEIEADSLGHDLLWGTSTFHKSARAAASSVAPVDDDGAWTAAGATTAAAGDQGPDAWNVPGGRLPDRDAEAAEPGGQVAQPQLALSAAPDGTPF